MLQVILKDLVKSINYDPAMLFWLDNDKNYYINENNNTINREIIIKYEVSTSRRR